MKFNPFSFVSAEGTEIFVSEWTPETEKSPKGIVLLSHGMAEHIGRYERFAERLTEAGYITVGHDHRGHGRTAGSVEKQGVLAKEKGFSWMVEDLHKLNGILRKKYGELPIFLFGHSMGSFVAQNYIEKYSNEIRGAILSGSNGKQGMFLKVAKYMAERECKKHGRDEKSMKLNVMSFGSYNNAFKPTRTDFDWLSRDPVEVDKYIADPYCGAIFTGGFFFDLLEGLIEIEKPSNIGMIRKNMPIYIFSGSEDPVSKKGAGVRLLHETYRNAGISDVLLKLYPGGRHEMLNEVNRDEVMGDVIEWLRKHN